MGKSSIFAVDKEKERLVRTKNELTEQAKQIINECKRNTTIEY